MISNVRRRVYIIIKCSCVAPDKFTLGRMYYTRFMHFKRFVLKCQARITSHRHTTHSARKKISGNFNHIIVFATRIFSGLCDDKMFCNSNNVFYVN